VKIAGMYERVCASMVKEVPHMADVEKRFRTEVSTDLKSMISQPMSSSKSIENASSSSSSSNSNTNSSSSNKGKKGKRK
jgi:hypothetical protein